MKIIATIVMAGLLLGLPILAWSCPGCMKIMQKLDLSEQKKAEIQTLCLSHQKTMIGLNDDLRTFRHQMKLLITTDNASSGDVKTLAGKISDAVEKIATERANHMMKVRALLTAEQKVKFDMFILSGPGKGRGRGMEMMGMQPCPPCPPCPQGPQGHKCPGGMGGQPEHPMPE
jgi:Spy/CpxP family protein refolding chaperone